MSVELVRIAVTESVDLMGMHADGTNWASLRYMCDSLGIDYVTQLRKLRSRSWATVGQRPTVAADGKVREMAVVTSDTIPLWLATIDENRVAEDARPRLIAYQREAAAALDAYFNKRAVVAPAVNQFDALRAMIDQLEAAEREAAEAKAIAQRTEARLDAIEGKHDWFSAIAYARINGLPTSSDYLRRLGGCAGRIGRSHGVEPTQVQHQLYGWVNSWPAWVWDLAAEGFIA